MSSTITLYHICSTKAYECLCRRGFLNGDARRSRSWLAGMKPKPYHWIAEQMLQRIGPRPKHAAMFPVWAWYLRDGQNKCDLRVSGFANKGAKCVALTLKVPREKVLLSGFDAWHCVLNSYPFTYNETEADDWDKRKESWPTSRYDAAMRKTWERIFNLKQHGDINWVGTIDYVQACLWVLDINYVTKIRFFTAR